MIDSILNFFRRIIPRPIFVFFQPAYHWSLAFLAALYYRFPSRSIKVIAVSGTKGKSSTVEILNNILEKAGHKTAVSNTIRFKIGENSRPNLHKMSMPGRFAMQRFLRQAVNEKAEYAIIEMTSQGRLLYRHLFIDLDMFIFTNISPEHIEAHGSFENYRQAKLDLAMSLQRSKKRPRTLIVNGDDPEYRLFLTVEAEKKIVYSLSEAEPYKLQNSGFDFTYEGENIHAKLSGLFNVYNILAATKAARSLGIETSIIKSAVENLAVIPGRVQKVDIGQEFEIVIDYAHTPDSLEKFYKVFDGKRKICVLGGTGGGRDTWKRSKMGEIADNYCDVIILTDEDPYDEDPMQIIADVKSGIKNKQASIIIDRREAIGTAIAMAKKDDCVLITGKGTDPYIMGPNGKKTPWSDYDVASQELKKLYRL